jgi:hypothetical protein
LVFQNWLIHVLVILWYLKVIIENIDIALIVDLETDRSRWLCIKFEVFREHPHMRYLINPHGLLVKLRCCGFLDKYTFLFFPLFDPFIHNFFHRFVNQILHFTWIKWEDILWILNKMTFGLSCCLARLFPHPSVSRSASCKLGHHSLHINHIKRNGLVIWDTIRVSTCSVLM